MRILITGYGPFGNVSANPSAVIVDKLKPDDDDKEAFRAAAADQVELVTKVIDVDYASALNCSNWALRELNVDFAIHIGVHPGSGCVFLEKRAFRNGYVSKDVQGAVPLRNCCELSECPQRIGQPEPNRDCRFTVLDLDRLRTALLQSMRDTPLNIQISEDPGRFLCGYIYYCSLLNLSGRSLFVHIPPFDHTFTPELITRLIKQIVIEVVKMIRPSPTQLPASLVSNGIVSFPLART
uniref:Pyroglutamyl-peptidase I n=1 Tax=Globodera rostochiensis TaxID=31243 RepID=A0A914HFE7_GLORO